MLEWFGLSPVQEPFRGERERRSGGTNRDSLQNRPPPLLCQLAASCASLPPARHVKPLSTLLFNASQARKLGSHTTTTRQSPSAPASLSVWCHQERVYSHLLAVVGVASPLSTHFVSRLLSLVLWSLSLRLVARPWTIFVFLSFRLF